MLANLIATLAPSSCVQCGSTDGPLCPKCARDNLVAKTPTCFGCNKLSAGGKTCVNCARRHSLAGVTVLYRLDGAVQRLVYQYKYEHDRRIAPFFAEKIAAQIKADKLKYDLVSFVPSDGPSQRARGFNQAKLLARETSRQLGVSVDETLLRVRHTPQVGHGRMERFVLVKNNFALAGTDVENKRVLLIDDVITTGATLDECARMLKRAGARSVWSIVIAKK